MTIYSPDAAHDLGSVDPGTSDPWRSAEKMLAIVGILLVASRFNIHNLLTAGHLFSVAMAPLWLGTLRRYVGAKLLLACGLLVVIAGLLLTLAATSDHVIRRATASSSIILMVGALASLGLLLWSRDKISTAMLVTTFGFGLLLGVSPSTGLFSSNPWKFGYSVPITVIALGLVLFSNRRWIEFTVATVLVGISAVTDARSSFAILLMTAALLLWQMRPRSRNRRGSAIRSLVGLGVLAAATYNIGVALIVGGYFGPQTQERSLRQLDEAGSLILGGRPEIAATIGLMKERWYGMGIGIVPNHQDIMAVKTAMSQINYDPNNGYVDNHMLGYGFSMHSIFGDLWVQAGIVGLAFVLIVAILVLRSIGQGLATRTASGIVIFLAVRTSWNIVFSPWYSSISLLVLLLALALERRATPHDDDLGTMANLKV